MTLTLIRSLEYSGIREGHCISVEGWEVGSISAALSSLDQVGLRSSPRRDQPRSQGETSEEERGLLSRTVLIELPYIDVRVEFEDCVLLVGLGDFLAMTKAAPNMRFLDHFHLFFVTSLK